MMKVLLINGSPRERGNTRAALDEIARTLAAEGVETELISVGTGPVSGCTACGACAKTGRCVLEGGVNEAVEALAAADGLIVGTPVHYASPAGALLAFLDRMFYAGAERFAHKPAAAFACARRAGTTASLEPNLRRRSRRRLPRRRGPPDRAESGPQHGLAAQMHRRRPRAPGGGDRRAHELYKVRKTPPR